MNENGHHTLSSKPSLLNSHLAELGVPESPLLTAADFAELQQAAAAGDPQAMGKLGLCYQFGWHVPADPQTGCLWLRRGAEAGSLEALTNWGVAQLHGHGVRRDELRALATFQQAARAGEVWAKLHLACAHLIGFDEVPARPQLGFSLLCQLANEGMPWAECYMGVCFLRGIGVEADVMSATRWLSRAADHGCQPAQWILEEVVATFCDAHQDSANNSIRETL